MCADAQKVDRAKLAQTEFSIIEFDPDTFRVLLDYLHTGSCPLTCVTIPGKFYRFTQFIHSVNTVYNFSKKKKMICPIKN